MTKNHYGSSSKLSWKRKATKSSKRATRPACAALKKALYRTPTSWSPGPQAAGRRRPRSVAADQEAMARHRSHCSDWQRYLRCRRGSHQTRRVSFSQQTFRHSGPARNRRTRSGAQTAKRGKQYSASGPLDHERRPSPIFQSPAMKPSSHGRTRRAQRRFRSSSPAKAAPAKKSSRT